MMVHHLSHIDLDGYGAQFVAKHFFEKITFYNANYGKEITNRLNEIIKNIGAGEHKEILILITDLNLSKSEAIFLQDSVNELNTRGFQIKLMLLDHHISGADVEKEFFWYFLDTQRSATKITFDTLARDFKILNKEDLNILEKISNVINSVDIWKEQESEFELGKVMMGMIAQAKELNRFMFDDENRELKFSLLQKSKDFLDLPNAEVLLDNEIFRFKKIALGGNPDTQTMDNIISQRQVELLESKKDECSIYCEEQKGFLSYCMGGISIVANKFLSQNSDFAFFIDINNRGNVSIRANGNCDVSELSKKYFNGGGHKNASGGKMECFKESFCYCDIKKQIQELLQEC